jgi:hypothetical protein
MQSNRWIQQLNGRNVESKGEGYHADRLKRGNAEELSSWHQLGGAMQAIGSKIRELPRAEQIPFLLDWLDKHPNTPIDQKQIILRLFGQPEELATATGDAIHEALQKGLKYAAEHHDDPALMKGLAGAFDDLDTALKGFDADMVETFGSTGIAVVEKFADSISRLGKAIKEIWPQVPGWLKSTSWMDTLRERATTLSPEQKQQMLMNDKGELAQKLADHVSPIAFHPDDGGSSSQAEDMLTRAVKTGMLTAFREWFASTRSGGGGGGATNASYSPPGDKIDNTPIGRAMRDAIGGGGPKVLDGADKQDNQDASTTGEVGGGGIDRDKWLGQLNANPALKDALYRHSLGENSDPMANQAVMEEAANRADIRGNKGFADHSNLKYFQGYYRGAISAKMRAMLDSNFDKVFRQGSDVAGGAIDNSSQWLSTKHERNGRFRTVVNYGGDRITGHHGVESFEVPGWGESGAGEKARWPAYRQNQLAEAAKRREQQIHSVKGDASLNIALDGFPKGTKTDLTYGGLFTSYNLSRGRQMEASEQK